MIQVPRSYDEWEYCITVECGIPLTSAYVAERIAALEDSGDFHTQRFVERWGPAHHARVLEWFRQAQDRLCHPAPAHRPA